VLLVVMVYPGMNGYKPAMFADMVYGRAHKPFVSRALVPSTVRWVTRLTPAAAKQQMAAWMSNNTLLRRLRWEREYLFEYAVTAAIMFACLTGWAVTLRHLVGRLYAAPPAVRDLAPIFGLLALPALFSYYVHIYDPATLLFFTLGSAAIAADRTSLLYPLLALATWNKETSLALVLLFILSRWRRQPLSTFAPHTLGLVTVWLAVKAPIAWLSRNNPGGFVEFHLLDHNLRLVQMPLRLTHFLAVVLLSAWLAGKGWRQKPVFLRDGLMVTFFPIFGLVMLLGYCDELRAYCEAFPFVFLLALPVVVRYLTGRELPQRS